MFFGMLFIDQDLMIKSEQNILSMKSIPPKI